MPNGSEEPIDVIKEFQEKFKDNKDEALSFYTSRMEQVHIKVVEQARDLAVANKLNEQLQEIIENSLRRY